jgi:hypothetical protein
MNTTPIDFFLEHFFLFVHKGALFLPISVLGSVPTLSNRTAESENRSNIIMGPDSRIGILSRLVKHLFSVF